MAVLASTMFGGDIEASALYLEEARSWVDRCRVVEANRTFKNGKRSYQFDNDQPGFVEYEKLDMSDEFATRRLGIRRRWPFVGLKSAAWRNERIQRNASLWQVQAVVADDIVVLGDIDEILDARLAGNLIRETHRWGILTVPLHHTLYWINVFSLNWHEVWPGSPSGYRYRLFLMSGEYYRKRFGGNYDKLRHMGESGSLSEKIRCFGDYAGFHHSWLGGTEAIVTKLLSYSHDLTHHASEFAEFSRDRYALNQLVTQRLASGKGLFDGHRLDVRNLTDEAFLKSVEHRWDELRARGLILDEGRQG